MRFAGFEIGVEVAFFFVLDVGLAAFGMVAICNFDRSEAAFGPELCIVKFFYRGLKYLLSWTHV